MKRRPPPSRKHPPSRHPPALRAFVACELGAEAKKTIGEVIAVLRQQPHGDSVHWTPINNLHVTLRFLGDIKPLHVARLSQHIGEAVRGIPAFPLQLNAVKPFPIGKSEILSISVTSSPGLLQLAQAVERGVQATGFQPEKRPFLPHITIGRPRTQTLPNFGNIPLKNIGACTIREIVLFRSDLKRSGAIHTPLVRIPL